jgi:hypothetical protein
MKTLDEITEKLFNVDFEKDLDDEKKYDEYVNMAADTIKQNGWENVYKSWYDYLINCCKSEDSIINFANLFWSYEGYKQVIPNPYEFCGYFYANICLEKQTDIIPVLDGITWNALVNSSIYSSNDNYFEDFSPFNDEKLLESIDKWKKMKK